MKLLSNFYKEMRISARGFYFYVEIVMAIILLVVLYFFVPQEVNLTSEEFIFYDVTEDIRTNQLEWIMNNGGKIVQPTVFQLKPDNISYIEETSRKHRNIEYYDTKEVTLETIEFYDKNNSKLTNIFYLVENFDDLIRLTNKNSFYGARIFHENNKLNYEMIAMGNEPDRVKNLSSVLHSDDFIVDELQSVTDKQQLTYLKNIDQLDFRESMLPISIVLLNGLMGMLLIIAFISVDKTEGLVKAFSVTSTSDSIYYLSKMLVVATIAILSSLMVVIPIMGLKPNYSLLLLSIFSMAFLSCSIGLLTSTFFHDVESSLGVLIVMVIIFMIPALGYLIPSFSPKWMNFIPSYYMLESVKETLLNGSNFTFVLITNLGMMILTAVLFRATLIRHSNNLG